MLRKRGTVIQQHLPKVPSSLVFQACLCENWTFLSPSCHLVFLSVFYFEKSHDTWVEAIMAENFCYSCLPFFVFFFPFDNLFSSSYFWNFPGARKSALVLNNYLNCVWLSRTVALMVAPSLMAVGQVSFLWSYYWVRTQNWMGGSNRL